MVIVYNLLISNMGDRLMNKKSLFVLSFVLFLFLGSVLVNAAYGNYYDSSFSGLEESFQKYGATMRTILYTALNVEGAGDGNSQLMNLELIMKIVLAVIIGLVGWLALGQSELFNRDNQAQRAARIVAVAVAWGAASLIPRSLLFNVYLAYSGGISLLIFGAIITGILYLRSYLARTIHDDVTRLFLNVLSSTILIFSLLLLNGSIVGSVNSAEQAFSGLSGITGYAIDANTLNAAAGTILFLIAMIRLSTVCAVFLLGYDIIRFVIVIFRLARDAATGAATDVGTPVNANLISMKKAAKELKGIVSEIGSEYLEKDLKHLLGSAYGTKQTGSSGTQHLADPAKKELLAIVKKLRSYIESDFLASWAEVDSFAKKLLPKDYKFEKWERVYGLFDSLIDGLNIFNSLINNNKSRDWPVSAASNEWDKIRKGKGSVLNSLYDDVVDILDDMIKQANKP
jgi:hypothetical protein